MKSYAEGLERNVEERTRQVEAANARLENALAQAEEASHDKSTFLANISHELRTPLNTIIGFSEILRGQHFGSLTDKQAQHMQTIHRTGHQVLQPINDLLDLSKVEAGRVELDRQTTPIDKLIVDALAMVKDQSDKKGFMVTFLPMETLRPLNVDPYHVTQILTNLLSNAVKFTPSGGRVCPPGRRMGGCRKSL